jgi:hypothetical protein
MPFPKKYTAAEKAKMKNKKMGNRPIAKKVAAAARKRGKK